MTTTIELADDEAALVFKPGSSTPKIVLPHHEDENEPVPPHELFTAALAYLSPGTEFQEWVFTAFETRVNRFLEEESLGKED